MERILTVAQMRSADKYTVENLGISQEILINRAGRAVAEEIANRFPGGRVLVCVGKGNNGADGKVIADKLSKIHGFSVLILNVENGIFKLFDKKYDIIVDCIFGTGLNKIVDGKYKIAIEKINRSGAFVVACDIASGINGDNGKVMGVAVKANLTVAIQDFKSGHFLNDGIDYSGKLVCKDIGISVWNDDFIKKISDTDAADFFKPRKRNINKGRSGKACVIGGSKHYTGSVILSSNALCALKMGIGYANLCVPESLFTAYVGKVPECTLTTVADDNGQIVFDKAALDNVLNYNSIAIGMGTEISEDIYKSIVYLLNNYEGKLIIDADGLNSLGKFGIEALKNKKCRVILTPHIAEFGRLTNIDKNEILSNPITIAKEFAKQYGVILLLKNAVSVITDGSEVYINTTGCNGMAKAGSGDVLSGFLAGILSRSVGSDLEAAVTASYLFGRAGEFAQKKINEFAMTATDIIDNIPEAINSLFK